ncbi:MAG TPA: RDD family protein [Ureibacillus sp.]|nr:RDD family protein [Ureibacillus sp.]
MTIEDKNGINPASSESQQKIKQATTQHIEVENEYEEKTVGFWIRFFAFIIDQGIVTAILGIVVYPLFKIFNWSLSDNGYFTPIAFISGIFYYGYFILMTKYFSQTLGKMIFGIRVQMVSGGKLDWATVIFRELIGRFITNKVLILYLLVIFMPKNNSLADYFADTVVIQENVYIKKKLNTLQQVPMNTQFIS